MARGGRGPALNVAAWRSRAARRARVGRTGPPPPRPGASGLLVRPRLPPSGGARLGGGDGVRLRGACETLGGRPDRDAPRAPLLGGLGGNRHCRQTYLPRGGLSTPLGPTRAICFRPDVEVAKRSDRRWGRAGTRGRTAPTRACKNA